MESSESLGVRGAPLSPLDCGSERINSWWGWCEMGTCQVSRLRVAELWHISFFFSLFPFHGRVRNAHEWRWWRQKGDNQSSKSAKYKEVRNERSRRDLLYFMIRCDATIAFMHSYYLVVTPRTRSWHKAYEYIFWFPSKSDKRRSVKSWDIKLLSYSYLPVLFDSAGTRGLFSSSFGRPSKVQLTPNI